MWGKFLDSVNSAVESAGGYEAVAHKGIGIAQGLLDKSGDGGHGGGGNPSSPMPAARDGDAPPTVEPWDSIPLTGNKKSVLIGINYRGQQGELRGCINDVIMMKQYIMEEQGFNDDPDHMLILTEDEPPENHPTKNRILEAMRWLVSGATPGDSLFFHYSGHGTRVPDLDGDEADGFDEAIVPLDFKTADMLIDDVVNVELVSKLCRGCRMTIIMDCCHSGSVCDLPYVFKGTDDHLVNWRAELPSMILSKDWDLKNFKSLLKTGTQLGKEIWGKYRQNKAAQSQEDIEAQFYREGTKAAMAEVIMFSGCKDTQTSADVFDTSTFELPEDCGPGGAGGACTNAFIATLHKKPKITYVELLDDMRIMLKEKRFSQVPCLSSSREVPLDAEFNMCHDP